MKKILNFCFMLIMIGVSLILVGCNKKNINSEIEEKKIFEEKLDIATLSGPTGFSLAYLDDEDYNLNTCDAPDIISSSLVKGDVLFATIPTNMAAILNNKTNGKIKILSVISKGNLYVVTTRDDIKEIDDLRGKTITLSGFGATPEIIASDIFDGLNIIFDYKSEHSEVVALLKVGKADIAILPEPYVTMAMKNVEGLKNEIDINEEWSRKYNLLEIPMSVLVMNSNYLTSSKDNNEIKRKKIRIEKLIKDVKTSIDKVNANYEESGKLIEEKKIIKVPNIAVDAIKGCNISFIEANDAKEMINKYFEIINVNNNKLIGEKVPDEEIYY